MAEADRIIAELGLERHPEGGWFRETWRAEAGDGKRGLATAIYFLLDAGERSHWHRVDATEIWLWHAGSPLDMSLARTEAGPVRTMTLGPDIIGGEAAQLCIAPDEWQAAEANRGWALVSCIVSPAFEFAGFELAAPGWSPGGQG